VFIPAGPVTQSFPGSTDIDRRIEELEERVSSGRISMEEYQQEITELGPYFE
jgi:uncharacterized coiled-coil protein SlyX